MVRKLVNLPRRQSPQDNSGAANVARCAKKKREGMQQGRQARDKASGPAGTDCTGARALRLGACGIGWSRDTRRTHGQNCTGHQVCAGRVRAHGWSRRDARLTGREAPCDRRYGRTRWQAGRAIDIPCEGVAGARHMRAGPQACGTSRTRPRDQHYGPIRSVWQDARLNIRASVRAISNTIGHAGDRANGWRGEALCRAIG